MWQTYKIGPTRDQAKNYYAPSLHIAFRLAWLDWSFAESLGCYPGK